MLSLSTYYYNIIYVMTWYSLRCKIIYDLLSFPNCFSASGLRFRNYQAPVTVVAFYCRFAFSLQCHSPSILSFSFRLVIRLWRFLLCLRLFYDGRLLSFSNPISEQLCGFVFLNWFRWKIPIVDVCLTLTHQLGHGRVRHAITQQSLRQIALRRRLFRILSAVRPHHDLK